MAIGFGLRGECWLRVRVRGATCVVAAWREVVRGEGATPATFQVRDGIRMGQGLGEDEGQGEGKGQS